MADEGTTAVADSVSVDLSVDAPTTEDPTTPEPANGFAIPEAYKDRQWAQNLLKTENPIEELFKQNDSAQRMIGERLQVPNEKSTPEQIKQFRKAIGVPDDHTGYEVAPIQWSEEDKPVGEYLASTRNPEFMDLMKQTAHAIGITPNQFSKIVEVYDRGMVAQHKAELAEIARLEQESTADFEQKADQMFGARKDAIMQNGQKMLQALTPEPLKPMLAALPNDALMILAGVLDSVRQKYIREDSFNQAGAGSRSVSSKQEISEEGRKLMAHPAFHDPTHAQHEEIVRKVKENYARLQG